MVAIMPRMDFCLQLCAFGLSLFLYPVAFGCIDGKHFTSYSNLVYNLLQLTRDEKTDLPNVKGEVKRAIKATFAHLCTTLTRDKCLHLPAVKGASSGDKGRFCHAFNPYL